MNTSNFDLTIRTRDTLLFQGKVKSISSQNATGRFDILGTHTNFITILRNTLTFILPNGEKKEIFVERGLLRVVESKVTVFLGFRHS